MLSCHVLMLCGRLETSAWMGGCFSSSDSGCSCLGSGLVSSQVPGKLCSRESRKLHDRSAHELNKTIGSAGGFIDWVSSGLGVGLGWFGLVSCVLVSSLVLTAWATLRSWWQEPKKQLRLLKETWIVSANTPSSVE